MRIKDLLIDTNQATVNFSSEQSPSKSESEIIQLSDGKVSSIFIVKNYQKFILVNFPMKKLSIYELQEYLKSSRYSFGQIKNYLDTMVAVRYLVEEKGSYSMTPLGKEIRAKILDDDAKFIPQPINPSILQMITLLLIEKHPNITRAELNKKLTKDHIIKNETAGVINSFNNMVSAFKDYIIFEGDKIRTTEKFPELVREIKLRKVNFRTSSDIKKYYNSLLIEFEKRNTKAAETSEVETFLNAMSKFHRKNSASISTSTASQVKGPTSKHPLEVEETIDPKVASEENERSTKLQKIC